MMEANDALHDEKREEVRAASQPAAALHGPFLRPAVRSAEGGSNVTAQWQHRNSTATAAQVLVNSILFRIFSEFDTDGDETITVDEMKIGVQHVLKVPPTHPLPPIPSAHRDHRASAAHRGLASCSWPQLPLGRCCQVAHSLCFARVFQVVINEDEMEELQVPAALHCTTVVAQLSPPTVAGCHHHPLTTPGAAGGNGAGGRWPAEVFRLSGKWPPFLPPPCHSRRFALPRAPRSTRCTQMGHSR